MTDTAPNGERELIGSGQNDAQVAGVLDGRDLDTVRIRPPLRWFTAERRIVRWVATSLACFGLVAVISTLTQYRTTAILRSTVGAQAAVISAQGKTIDVERSRSAQIERQAADLQSQVSDQQNQTLCRSQITNDFESLKTDLDLLVSHRDRVFREALSAILQGDRDGFTAKLAEVAGLDPQIADLEPKVNVAKEARQESVTSCQKASATTTTTAPGG